MHIMLLHLTLMGASHMPEYIQGPMLLEPSRPGS